MIVDDDIALCRRLQTFFAEHGFCAETAHDGRAALARMDSDLPDLVLLDLGLPHIDGIEVLRGIQSRGRVPVIVLTSKSAEGDVILALELGADDYVVKPFRSHELLARARAVLRRAGPPLPIVTADLQVDIARRQVRCRGEDIELSSVEIDLLAALMNEPGKVMDRSALLRRAGRAVVVLSDRTVDVHISRLRRKLEVDPKHPELIKTVHGRGYVFVPPK